MPRLTRPDPFALAIGQRIRQLRVDAGLTIERLAYETEVGSKGHLSSIERGLVRPTAHTIKAIADGLGVLPLDLLTFPENSEREALVDRTRTLSKDALRRWLKESERTGKRRGRAG